MIMEKNKENLKGFKLPPSQLNLEIEFKRKETKCENLSGKFTSCTKDFQKQFSHIYVARLTKTKDRVAKACAAKWGNEVPICKLADLSEMHEEKCIVIGTLFKHQELKPSILKELSEENQIMPQPSSSNFVTENDLLILEDEVQRIRLMGVFAIKKLVTGIVIGVLGFEDPKGRFTVEEMCFAGVNANIEKPLTIPYDCYILMVSGLNLSNSENMLALELLVDWVKGNLGSTSDQEKWAKVCKVIIAGNSIKNSNFLQSLTVINTGIKEGPDTITAIKQLDDILFDLAQTVEVDLMPGEFDPSNHILPQQGFFNCVFAKAFQYESFNSVTNPYEFKIQGRRILGSSGQPVDDIKAVTDISSSLEILEKTLQWGHLAPTAPDTLACYPYYKDDPFIIADQPDVYFAGNQPDYQTKLLNINGRFTRLICIPAFSTTQMCVIVNLKTLECFPLTFTLGK